MLGLYNQNRILWFDPVYLMGLVTELTVTGYLEDFFQGEDLWEETRATSGYRARAVCAVSITCQRQVMPLVAVLTAINLVMMWK